MRISGRKFGKQSRRMLVIFILLILCLDGTAVSASAYTQVIYHGNGATGGSVPVDDSYYETGAEVTVLGPGSLERSSSVFVGWNTAADGSGTTYLEGETFLIDGEVHLYAQWGVISHIHYAYMAGYTDGRFGPSDAMTRAEVAQMFYNLNYNGEEIPLLTGKGSGKTFSDVSEGAWYYDAVMLLSDYGIVSGYDDGTFLPGNRITRAEFAAMIVMAAGVTKSTSAISLFSDMGDGHWAVSFINTCKERSYVSGYTDGTFRPDSYITRAKVVSIVNKVLGRGGHVQFSSGLFPDVGEEHWAYKDIMEAGVTHGYYINSAGEEVWLAVYTVTYDGNSATGGDVPEDSAVYAVNMRVTAASAGSLVRKGYDFTGWNTRADGSGISYAAGGEFLMGESNVRLYAQWEQQADRTTEIVSVTSCPDITVDYGTAASALGLVQWAEVTLQSGAVEVLEVEWDTEAYRGDVAGTYTLVGALLLPSDGSVRNSGGYTASVRVIVRPEDTGEPEPAVYYTVHFDSNGGSSVSSVQVAHGEPVAKPADPTRTGYVFAGWYLETELYDFELAVLRDLTLVAHWSDDGYTVTFDTDGESEIAPVLVPYGEPVAQPADPVRAGYAFTGWYREPEGTLYDFSTPVTGDLTLRAGWEAERYRVTYHRNGASGTPPSDSNTYAYGEMVRVLFSHSMTYEDAVFLGWATTSDAKSPQYTMTGTVEFVITGDTDLYAVWSRAVARIEDTDYNTLEEALADAKTGQTIYLNRSASLNGSYQTAQDVTLAMTESVTLVLEAGSLLEIGAVTYAQNATLVNEGVILGRVSGDFVTGITQTDFGSYQGSGVVFAARKRYEDTENGGGILSVSSETQAGGAVSSYGGGLLEIGGGIGLSVHTLADGAMETNHWLEFEYAVPQGTTSVATSYATFKEGQLVSEAFDGANTVIGDHSASALRNGRYLQVKSRAQYYSRDGYVLYCPTLYTLEDGETYMELFQVDYSGLRIDREMNVGTVEGELYLQGGAYTIPAGRTVTVSAGTRVGCSDLDLDGNRTATAIVGVDDTSVLVVEAGSSLHFLNGADNNFYDSSKIQLNVGLSDALYFSADTAFWWDVGVGGWVMR